MTPIKRTLTLAALCGLLPTLGQAESPETPDVLPGKGISVPYGGMYKSSGDLAFHTARDKDFYCFRNEYNFPWMKFKITTSDLDFDDYIEVKFYDHNFNVMDSEKFYNGDSETVTVYPWNGYAWYVSFVDDGTMDEDGFYEFEIWGEGGTNPAIKQAAINAMWGNWNRANKKYKKYWKRYKKLKKDKKKRATKSGKKKLKKDKKKYKKYKKQRDSYRRQLSSLYAS